LLQNQIYSCSVYLKELQLRHGQHFLGASTWKMILKTGHFITENTDKQRDFKKRRYYELEGNMLLYCSLACH